MPARGKGKFTPARQEQFLTALRSGMTRAAAAGLLDIDRSVITQHCARSSTFSTQCRVAEAVAEARFVAVVVKAAASDPRYALEWLKRRRKEDWGDSLTLTVLQKIAAEAEQMSDEDLLAVMGYEPAAPGE
jgi:hypothetical protein